jgi:hypothetical protein
VTESQRNRIHQAMIEIVFAAGPIVVASVLSLVT